MIDVVKNLPHSVILLGTSIKKKQAALTRGLLRHNEKAKRLIASHLAFLLVAPMGFDS